MHAHGATTHTGLVEKCVNIFGVDAARHPTRKVLSILGQFHVAVPIEDVRVDDGKISRLIVCRRRGRDTFWHGGKREKWYKI
jgi:hypothetical protein